MRDCNIVGRKLIRLGYKVIMMLLTTLMMYIPAPATNSSMIYEPNASNLMMQTFASRAFLSALAGTRRST